MGTRRRPNTVADLLKDTAAACKECASSARASSSESARKCAALCAQCAMICTLAVSVFPALRDAAGGARMSMDEIVVLRNVFRLCALSCRKTGEACADVRGSRFRDCEEKCATCASIMYLTHRHAPILGTRRY